MTVKIDGTNTEANPAFTGADTDTGLQCGTNELKLVTGGSARATVDSSGNLGIGTTAAFSNGSGLEVQRNGTACLRLDDNTNSKAGEIYADSSGLVIDSRGSGAVTTFDIGGSERMRLDNDGHLQIRREGVAGVTGTDTRHTRFIVRQTNGQEAILGSVFAQGKSGWGGDLVFASKNANSDPSSGLTERMRLLASGGLTFNGDTAAANALDDYEEGAWTPTIRQNGNGPAWDTISTNTGYYTKIGDCVTFAGTLYYSGVATNVNTGFYGWLAGFPFSSSSSKKSGQFFISFLYSGVRTVLYSGYFIHGNSYAGIYKNQDTSSPGPMMTNEFPTGAHTVEFQGHYYV